MDESLLFLFIILTIWLILYIILEFNIINNRKKEINKVFLELDDFFSKRLILLSKMLDIVKNYDKNQFDVLSSDLYDYVNSYSEYEINKKLKINEKLDVNIKKMLLVSKVYPEIVENSKYIKMEKQLVRYNRRILKLQVKYNKAVNIFYERKKIFPSNILVSILQFYQYDFFNIKN